MLPQIVSRKINSFRSRAKQTRLTILRRLLFGSSSQYGEDLIVDAILGKPRPFYVDIGANHPEKLSNTIYFYRRGANGINVEPDPTVFPLLARCRPRDTNLQMGVGQVEGELPFYQMNVSSLSTFDRLNADDQVKAGYRLVETIRVPVMPLRRIMEKHAPGKIDFMSIDVEGHEMEILRSNDWDRFRPRLLILEINRAPQEIPDFVSKLGYLLIVNNNTNAIFLDLKAEIARTTLPAGC